MSSYVGAKVFELVVIYISSQSYKKSTMTIRSARTEMAASLHSITAPFKLLTASEKKLPKYSKTYADKQLIPTLQKTERYTAIQYQQAGKRNILQ